jgi:rubrerythrin
MRGMLELCVEMDTFAHDTYIKMSKSCSNADLAQIFSHMAIEEKTHVGWWKDLLDAWDQGLIPDIVNDTDSVEHHMQSILAELKEAVRGDVALLSDDEMLDVSARVEFFLLDSAFGELMDLTEPGGAKE